jgi:hypothetical protein
MSGFKRPSRVLRNPQTIEMTRRSLSTPCVKTGFFPKLLSASGETRVRVQAVETVFQQPARRRWIG